MANTDNDCSHLNIGDQEFPGWDYIFNLQKTIQEKTYGYDFKSMSLKQVVDFWLMNKHALEDELSEMFDALGGINHGIGNAVWKPWKKENALTCSMGVDSLSEPDRVDLLMEYVDVLHFFINFGVSIGFTGKEVANAYISKNQENIKRQKEGY